MNRIVKFLNTLFILSFITIHSGFATNEFVRIFTSTDGLAHDRVKGFCQDSSGIIWICTWYGLERYDGYRFQCFRPQEELDTNSRMNKAILTPDNCIVVKTVNDKQLSFSLKDYTYSIFEGEYPKEGIALRSPFIDNMGNIWERISQGIRLVGSNPMDYDFVNNHTYPIPRAFYEDSQHRLWIAWSEDTGKSSVEGDVSIYNLNGEKIKTILTGEAVYSIHEDRYHNIWLGTRSNGLIVLKPNEKGGYSQYQYSDIVTHSLLPYNIILDIEEDCYGRIWLATLGGGIYIVEPNYNINNLTFMAPQHYPIHTHDRVRGLMKSDEYMLIATDNGLIKSNICSTTDSLTFIPIDVSDTKAKPADELIHIYQTKEEKILVSSFGKGIYEFDNKTDRYFPFVADDIAEKQAVYSILENPNGKLWITTQTNLLLYEKGGTCESPFYEHFSMIETQPLCDSKGQCWFATRNGALCVKSNEALPTQILTPNIVFTDISFHLPDSTITRPLTLADTVLYIQPEERNLSLHVSALQYCNMNNVRYFWRIVEQDTIWSTLKEEHKIMLPLIKPGRWTLEVRSTDNRGHWLDNTASLHFNVVPQWHEMSLARGIMAIILFAGISLWIWFLLKFKRIQKLYNSLLESQPIVMVRAAMTDIKPEEMLTEADQKFIDNLNTIIKSRMNEQNFSMDALASSMSMSRSVFYRRLKGVVGQSPVEYVNEFRLQYATELLDKEPEKAVSQIAYECGFSSPQYFSNVFRKRNHMTPSEWRQRQNDRKL